MAQKSRRTTNNAPPTSVAPVVIPLSVVLAAVAIYFGQPGTVLVWLGLLVAAMTHPPVELTGKKDDYGRPVPGNLAEKQKLADYQAAKSMIGRLMMPGGHWLPGWPPLGYWLFSVALAVLALAIPTWPLEVLADHENKSLVSTVTALAALGPIINSVTVFVCATALFATARQKAGPDCPGTRMGELFPRFRDQSLRSVLLTLGAPLLGAAVLYGLLVYEPSLVRLAADVPLIVWLALVLTLALAVHTPFLREASLEPWRKLVAARAVWEARWPAVKMHDPMATLVDRTKVGENTVDVFDAPTSVGAGGYMALAPKLAPVVGSGHAVVILSHPQLDPDGAPMPGTADPVRFRVIDIDESAPVDLADPSVETGVVENMVEAAMARATDALGIGRAPLVSLESLHTDDSPQAAYRVEFAGLSWGGLRPQVASLPGFFGCEVLVDHKAGQLFVGALLGEPASFEDPSMSQALEQLAVQDRWNVFWGAASLARHKVSQPTVSHPQCATGKLADGTVVERTVFLTRVGIPPSDYFGREEAAASSLNGAPFVAITGYPGTGSRPGERHAQALCLYHSNRPVPSTLERLTPVEGAGVATVDARDSDSGRPGRGERRRPMGRRGRPAPSLELPTHWVIAGMMNKAFESAKLKRPEVVEARALTLPEPSRGPHLWRIHLRLHDVTLADVRSASGRLRQALGVPWLRVAEAADGVTIFAGGDPAKVRLINPTTDRATLVSLDWEETFHAVKLVSPHGETPKLLDVGHLEHNEKVAVLDFTMPNTKSTEHVKGTLKKLRGDTGNEFIELRPSPHGPSAFRLYASKINPVPFPAPFQFDLATRTAQTADELMFATNVEGEPVAVDLMDGSHVLVAGTSGSGKTALAQGLLFSAASGGMQIVVCDAQKEAADFEFLRSHASAYAITLEEVAAALQAAYAEGNRRIKLNRQYKVGHSVELPEDVQPPRLVVFVDEFTSLLDKETVPAKGDDIESMEAHQEAVRINMLKNIIGRYTGKIARELRSARVSLMLGTQKLSSKTLESIPGGSDLKDQLARILLGNPSVGATMSTLRNYESMPDLGETIPKGRGVFEPLSSPAPFTIQAWFAPQGAETDTPPEGTYAHAISSVPVAGHLPLDMDRFMPKSTDDEGEYGPPPGFGQDEDVVEEPADVEAAEVTDLGELDLELDLEDLEIEEINDELDDEHHEAEDGTEAGGDGAPDIFEPVRDESEGSGLPPQGGPELVGATDSGGTELPVGGSVADAGGSDPAGDVDGDPGPGGDADSGSHAGDRDGPDLAADGPGHERPVRVSNPWDDDDDFEVPAGGVAPDRSKMTAEDLFG
ncbi:FtsK/SpoIIIE domain-containing protein [Ornithinimicrobium murale]|uniref:FtsK/SpoIIIE domain-containing protein n=1 Tax=Ornithinimicrobium murale TaxID=1050153 RepID=UPI000E0DD8A7|nr:FtsK/SpoIIIE domain-containing protein [Ornithinimicrobium murale]